MTSEPATPICDMIEKLLSQYCPADKLGHALEVVRLAEAAMARSPTGRGSIADRRERERLRKARWRSENPGHVPGQSGIALTPIKDSKIKDSKKKERKSDLDGPAVPRDKPKRDKGQVLPADWMPKPSHYAKGTELGFDRARVDFFAERMRNWAGANAHRQVARKSNWDLAFHNWLSDKAEKNGGSNARPADNGQRNARGGDAVFAAARRRAGAGSVFGAAPGPAGPMASAGGMAGDGRAGPGGCQEGTLDLRVDPGPGRPV